MELEEVKLSFISERIVEAINSLRPLLHPAPEKGGN
jgi:hypothetical protein